MICGIAVAAGGQALAQSSSTELVVTGSRIPTQNLTSVSPVNVVGSQEVKNEGVTKVEDLLNSLPQVFAGQGSSLSNGATGTATVNLRGLGSSRTLVLIDGRRLAPGDPALSSQAADLNFIPSSLIDRVEIDTGGASAVYGADAVAGVVNFIMMRNFEGVKLDSQYSFYNHQQHGDAGALAANTARGFTLPGDVGSDGEAWDTTLTLGINAPDGKGNVTAYATYRHVNAILEGERDFSNCTLNSGDAFTCGGSGTANPARVGNFGVVGSGASATFGPRAAIPAYNFGPTNYFLRPDERYSFGAFAHYEVKPWADVYTDLMFMDDRSVAQIAPGGIFAGTQTVNCDNAFMTPAQQATLAPFCDVNGNFTGVVARRNVEGGGRQSSFRHSSYRIVLGVKGDLGMGWRYDAYGQYQTTIFNSSTLNYFLIPHITNALIARKDANGNIVCQSVLDGTDPSCVPYNIFSAGGVTQAALNYLQVPSYNTGGNREWVASSSLTGDLGNYGLKSPWANDGVGVALGAEYRQEQLDFDADFTAQQGLLSGAGGAAPSVHAGYHLWELYTEARLPIVQDMPWVKDLTFETGYRYSKYSTGVKTDTYKFAGDYVPVQGIRFRASYQRAVRAPNVLELYSPAVVGLDGTTDPCAGLAANDPLVAKCASAFNLSAAQVLAIEPNPAPQYNGLLGGNTQLNPETSDTYSWGAVLTPPQVPGLSVSVDYFRIQVRDFISSAAGGNADTFITRCVQSGDPNSFFCKQVHRDNLNSLWLSTNGFITDTVLNTGSTGTSGIDLEVNYRTSLDKVGLHNAGSLSFNFVGTWLDTLLTQTLPGDPKFDCTGYYGTVCGTPNPEWRHKARLTWSTPWWGSSLSLQWRYFSSVALDATNAQMVAINAVDPSLVSVTDNKLGARSYFDLTLAVKPRDGYVFRIGANNIFDKDPPINGSNTCPTGPCNGNTWPQVYDALGRYVFVSLTADF